MDAIQAQRVIESLRKGIPADGFVRHFTVGRKTEIEDLTHQLNSQNGTVLLLNANWGAGKSHLIKYIREQALDLNYAMSTVTLDASSAVRFNRMDQIFGSICRNIEVPQESGHKGIRPFFDLLVKLINKREGHGFWKELSNNYKWDFSERLDSPGMYVALRAWATGNSEVKDFVEDWLYQPWQYKSQRKKLYAQLVGNLRMFFRDPRPESKFYSDEVFMFHKQGYAQSWEALRDLDILSRAAGLKGMIILFDEFEDIITNIRNIAHQEAAFWNLFLFYAGKQFPGKTFYAVTPEFSEKCKNRLVEKGKWDFDFSTFDSLPKFEMSPLEEKHLVELAKRIVPVHGLAYDWDSTSAMNDRSIQAVVKEATQTQIQDRTRKTIIHIVEHLDDLLDDSL